MTKSLFRRFRIFGVLLVLAACFMPAGDVPADDISLVNQGISSRPREVGPNLSIDAGAGRHAINEDIYGMNYTDEGLALELKLPVRRWGGNSTTRYNWQTNMHNTGSDYYFENIPDGATGVDGSASDLFVDQNRRTGTKTLMTIPLIGWTPKGTSSRAHPYDCGFKVSKYGPQQSTDPWDPDCGNGVLTNGANLTGNDPADTSTQIGPDFVTGWIQHLTAKYGAAASGGVAYYDLDNEPMLWNSTHRDVHPQPTSYDELRNRTYQYAAAIKFGDPSARTFGPVLWGWCAYFYSALDGCGIGADYINHGNTPFTAWYLQQMKAYEQTNGVRILDYLDLHFYPQANGVALSPAGNSSTQALRLRSTRSLWDPSYIDESWISDTAPGGVAVRMIPRMKEWVGTNYPGTKLAISEYNWGALDHINGALAQADVLGIFGRESLDLATLWGPPATTDPGAFAFRIYRNYDGSGNGFGNESVVATSSDQDTLAVYAARRSADNALTVIVINKTVNSLTSPISLSGYLSAPTAAVYRYSSTHLRAIEHAADQVVTAGGFTSNFPGNSITLFVLMPGGSKATYDFNGDGQADILWRNTATGQVWLYLMNGTAISAQGAVATVSDSNWVIQGIGDFNGDGKADVLWRNTATGQVWMYLMNGMSISAQGAVGAVSDLNWQIQGIGDFDGDGRADILWRNVATGEIWMWLMTGTSISSQGSVGVVSDLNWKIQGVGDFNGDGQADILWRHATTGQVWMYLMNGMSISAQGAVGVVSDLNWQIQGIGDFNGDGKADILWRHATTGQVWLYLMNGTAIASQGSVATVSDSNWKTQLLFAR
ncbi:MAG: VCBS repeat-containing protein [Deltaproteobacteria bacterium]|nr:VCBS repeat-containing protein [Deltaproteobacteria bacterium]